MKKVILLLVVAIAAYLGYQNMSGSQAGKKSRPRPTPNVVVVKSAMAQVRDEVEALGTSKAFESVTITPKVTELVTGLHFDDGDEVKKGDLLVQLHDLEAKARVKVAEVKVEENRREYNRIRSLVTKQTVAELERDRLQTQIDTARAELEQAQSALADRAIVAPFSGRLGLRQISLGSLVSSSTQITTLDDVSTIKLDFSVPERFLQELAVGKQVEAVAVAYEGKFFSGKVSSIDSRVNPVTRAVIVRAEIPNKDHLLLPGMLMKVKLIKQSRQAMLLPESAIIPIQKNHFVYVVNSEDKVERKQVEVGLRSRGWVEIVKGLELGEKVIIRGILKVRPNDKVKVQVEENFTFKIREEGQAA